jgi:hypothetical protein
MALEHFTTEESTTESFDLEPQQALSRELLAERATMAPAANGESSLMGGFLDLNTESIYANTISAFSTFASADFGYDLPAPAPAEREGQRPAADDQVRELLRQELKQIPEVAQMLDRAQKPGVSAPGPAQPVEVALPQTLAAPQAGGRASASGGDSMKQMSQMMQSAAPMVESLAPVLQEVLPQLIEQVGPMMEELVPMISEAAGSIAGAI